MCTLSFRSMGKLFYATLLLACLFFALSLTPAQADENATNPAPETDVQPLTYFSIEEGSPSTATEETELSGSLESTEKAGEPNQLADETSLPTLATDTQPATPVDDSTTPVPTLVPMAQTAFDRLKDQIRFAPRDAKIGIMLDEEIAFEHTLVIPAGKKIHLVNTPSKVSHFYFDEAYTPYTDHPNHPNGLSTFILVESGGFLSIDGDHNGSIVFDGSGTNLLYINGEAIINGGTFTNHVPYQIDTKSPQIAPIYVSDLPNHCNEQNDFVYQAENGTKAKLTINNGIIEKNRVEYLTNFPCTGILAEHAAQLTINNCTIRENVAKGPYNSVSAIAVRSGANLILNGGEIVTNFGDSAITIGEYNKYVQRYFDDNYQETINDLFHNDRFMPTHAIFNGGDIHNNDSWNTVVCGPNGNLTLPKGSQVKICNNRGNGIRLHDFFTRSITLPFTPFIEDGIHDPTPESLKETYKSLSDMQFLSEALSPSVTYEQWQERFPCNFLMEDGLIDGNINFMTRGRAYFAPALGSVYYAIVPNNMTFDGFGGGIVVATNHAVITGGQISNNVAKRGGGIFVYAPYHLNLSNLWLGENRAFKESINIDDRIDNSGGRSFYPQKEDHLRASFILADFLAPGRAGGIWFQPLGKGSCNIYSDTTFYNNLADTAEDDFLSLNDSAKELTINLPSKSLTGIESTWYEDGQGNRPNTDTPFTKLQKTSESLSLKATYDDPAAVLASKNDHSLIISNNRAYFGGGMACYGSLSIGEPTEEPRSSTDEDEEETNETTPPTNDVVSTLTPDPASQAKPLEEAKPLDQDKTELTPIVINADSSSQAQAASTKTTPTTDASSLATTNLANTNLVKEAGKGIPQTGTSNALALMLLCLGCMVVGFRKVRL